MNQPEHYDGVSKGRRVGGHEQVNRHDWVHDDNQSLELEPGVPIQTGFGIFPVT